MEKPEDTIKKHGPLRWLATTLLIFVLITFSGYVPQPGLFVYQPTKTEIAEPRKQTSQSTVFFKKVFCELIRPIVSSEFGTGDFSVLLLHDKNRIVVAFKNSLGILQAITREEGFLLHYSTDKSEGFDENHLMG